MRKTQEWIWLDMDGTIADLYSVNGWLNDLIAHNTRPYREAKNMYEPYELLSTLLDFKLKGYNIGIISWGSKENNSEYDKAVEETKKEWLKKYFFDLVLDKIIVTAYGVKKSDTCRQYGKGILIDDEEQNRNNWDLGLTIDANKNIIAELKTLL